MAKKIIGVDINYTTKENKKVSINLEQVANTTTNKVKTTLRYIDGNTWLIYTSWKDIAEIDRK